MEMPLEILGVLTDSPDEDRRSHGVVRDQEQEIRGDASRGRPGGRLIAIRRLISHLASRLSYPMIEARMGG
jgi:hypothetical protein